MNIDDIVVAAFIISLIALLWALIANLLRAGGFI